MEIPDEAGRDDVATARDEISMLRELIDAELDSGADEAVLRGYAVMLLRKKARLARLEGADDGFHSVHWDAA